MKTTAAVLVETGKLLEIVELEIPTLAPGQVLVEIAYSGVCHTQVMAARGYRGADPFLPHCLGHEGSGRVVDAGSGVTKVRPGDRVVLSWIKGGGLDVPGTRYTWGDRVVNAGGITTFSNHSVLSETRVTPVPDTLDDRRAAVLGCAVPTGFGAVINTAQARPGQSIAIFGAGGVGLSAVAAARLAGCAPVIAIDLLPKKLDLARRVGATDTVDAGSSDVGAEIVRLCPGGLDLAIEATGRPAVMAQALGAVRAQGGTAVVIGNARFGERLELDPRELNQGKRLFGTWGGDSQPDRDFPRFGKLVASDRVDLSPLIARTYPLDAINQVLADLEAGEVGRPLIQLAGSNGA